MKVVYKTIVDHINLVVETAKQEKRLIDKIILTEKEASEYFSEYKSLFKMGEMNTIDAFKLQLITHGFYHRSIKLQMEKP